MGVSEEIRDDIDRLTEQFQLEGRSVLELPEQLAAALAVVVCRQKGGLPMSENDPKEEKYYSAEELYAVMGKHVIWAELLGKTTIVSSRQLRRELLRFAQSLLEKYPALTPTDFSPLGGVMEYLLDAISRRGNKGFFFTPVNIARFMITLAQPGSGTLWDPACGSGMFLAEAVRSRKTDDYSPDLFGTDINEQMMRIARINAFFHGIRGARIIAGDAMEEQRQFDVIVANPPVVAGRSDRLRGHIAPTSVLHLQYLQMIPERLLPGGRAAVLVNENVLFSPKRTETAIREALVEEYGLWAVLSLPRGAFAPYTNGKSSILLFGKDRQFREGILFYELRHLGYTLDRRHAEKTENDIPAAVAACEESESLFDKWNMTLQRGETFNADGIVIPEDWQEENFWFADRRTVRENGYTLLPDRYRPRRREEQAAQEDYRELLDKLFRLEQEAGEQMMELRDIFQREWI